MRRVSAAMLALLLLPVPAAATPTDVNVYVLSRGAKFVGSSMGGARVTITDAASGEVLAQGVTEGGTGDTALIMGRREAGTNIVDTSTAAFSATLDLAAPTRVRVSAYGPLDYPASANTVTAEQWLLPGAGSGKPGWIVELPGLVVDVHDTPTLVALEGDEVRINVQAKVMMMCGCPLTPGGTWDADEFEIRARVMLDQQEITAAELQYAGESSEFQGELLLALAGEYRLLVQAHQPRTGNTGVIERPLLVR